MREGAYVGSALGLEVGSKLGDGVGASVLEPESVGAGVGERHGGVSAVGTAAAEESELSCISGEYLLMEPTADDPASIAACARAGGRRARAGMPPMACTGGGRRVPVAHHTEGLSERRRARRALL